MPAYSMSISTSLAPTSRRSMVVFSSGWPAARCGVGVHAHGGVSLRIGGCGVRVSRGPDQSVTARSSSASDRALAGRWPRCGRRRRPPRPASRRSSGRRSAGAGPAAPPRPPGDAAAARAARAAPLRPRHPAGRWPCSGACRRAPSRSRPGRTPTSAGRGPPRRRRGARCSHRGRSGDHPDLLVVAQRAGRQPGEGGRLGWCSCGARRAWSRPTTLGTSSTRSQSRVGGLVMLATLEPVTLRERLGAELFRKVAGPDGDRATGSGCTARRVRAGSPRLPHRPRAR